MINSINLQIAIEYLYEGTPYSKLETKFFQAKQNNHGGRVGTILNNLGIKSQHKAILKYKNIDDEISTATGQYKDTLLEIKQALSSGGIIVPKTKTSISIPQSTFKPLTEQEKLNLIDLLYQKIFEEKGIKDLASLLTGIDKSRDFDIKLDTRKKMRTDFYIEVDSFLKNYIPNYVHFKYDDLQIMVKDIINAEDNKTHHNVLKPYIQEMLEIIIGNNYTKNIKICDKALSYLEKLKKAILIQVLNGEYKEKVYDSERYYSVITLYLANIWDYCQDNNFDYYEMIFTVLSHEYFHLHHFACLHEYNSLNLDKGISKYNPGKIIKESLASYFECTYAKFKNYNDIANNLIDSWNKNDENYWPYAGAKSITNNSHFADIFHESLHSFKKALSIKNN